ncbi:MAG: glutathione S-transferase family protein [Pseudomonadota bacterium]
MKIYGNARSGNCLKVSYTADYLGLPYEWIEIDIMQGESRTDSFRAINPQGQVPAVQFEDGRTLVQSNAIIRYLAAGSDLLPGDPYLQAKIDEWLFWEQYSHEPYVAVCRFQMLFLGKAAAAREPWRVERGEAALDLMEQRLDGVAWFDGRAFSIADIALLAYTRVAGEGGFDLAPRQNVTRWIAACEGRLAAGR